MSQLYSCKPSDILNVQDEYTAFCLNEACAYIRIRIENGEEPVERKHYDSFSDVYAELMRGGVSCQ